MAAPVTSPPALCSSVRALHRIDDGHDSEPHIHSYGQLVHILSGVLHGESHDRRWLLQAGTAIWIPPDVIHSGHAAGQICSQVIYLYAPNWLARLPTTATLIRVSPLLHELLARAVTLTEHSPLTDAGYRLIDVLVDEIVIAPHDTMVLDMPRDARLKRICNTLVTNPADVRTLHDWANQVGATERTLRRYFLRETGLSWLQWRQRLQLRLALIWLAEGLPIHQIAERLGYDSNQGFSHWFKRHTSLTPIQYRQCNLSDLI
ncbi:helix-turn-helix transcriptional regulator [Chitinivorax sp. B]|uniref:AraC family transcriptional regulator n=1 Tax=Chitinivorax sp. B TaxID=2502235 RepID=UPI001484D32C|nr:helix-turn-helix transcriptional regulator [Chitinivorax sp. B]